ncbi:PepSY domain-containing protein [Lentibacillus sp. N15]|uniref:PepSY domain-containing protein n=1 Tax=Lentibacillus songyuanensis TaxID=3136161 RepID=UPI0031BA6D2C
MYNNQWNTPYGYANWQNQGYGYHGINQNQAGWYRQITIEDAMQIALQQVPGEVVKVELDTNYGVEVYEVEIVTNQGTKYEVEVDRETGRIVNIELD